MSDLGNKEVLAKNLKKYINNKNISRKELSKVLDVPYSTLSDWINAKIYPRIDKIELLADYFKIEKSDLIEDKSKTEYIDKVIPTSDKEKEVIESFKQLNSEGQDKVVSYTKDLVDSGKYENKDSIIRLDNEEPTREEMLAYLSGMQIAAYGGGMNPYKMSDERLREIYTIIKESDKDEEE